MVPAVRVEPVEVVHEVGGVLGITGDQVVVGRNNYSNVEGLGQLGRLSEVGVAYDVLGGAEVVAPVDRDERHVDAPPAEPLDQAVIDYGIARMVDSDAVPLDNVAKIRIAVL